jgi:hypothetical protein
MGSELHEKLKSTMVTYGWRRYILALANYIIYKLYFKHKYI